MLNSRNLLLLLLVATVLVLGGCATRAPANTDNLCSIFDGNRSWYKQAKRAEERWGTPVPVMMAFIHQESRFQAKARPPRNRVLWIFPGFRQSSSYGYAQALDSTWAEYRRHNGSIFSRRSRFKDAIDFVGWYNHKSVRRCNIRPDDAYNLYLAYHEGQGGYNRGSYRHKQNVKNVARRVAARAERYQRQYHQCRSQLERRWVFF